MGQVVIASRLADGLVVFLDEAGNWVEKLADGAVAESDADAERLLETAMRSRDANQVIDPYLIDVTVENGAVQGTSFREVIRTQGPTNRTDVGKQAE